MNKDHILGYNNIVDTPERVATRVQRLLKSEKGWQPTGDMLPVMFEGKATDRFVQTMTQYKLPALSVHAYGETEEEFKAHLAKWIAEGYTIDGPVNTGFAQDYYSQFLNKEQEQ